MVSRFRRELTVIPPVQIAVSRQGIATTIDWRSERADRGLPGYPHSFRIVGDPSRAGPLPTDRFLIPGTRQDFGGGDLARMNARPGHKPRPRERNTPFGGSLATGGAGTSAPLEVGGAGSIGSLGRGAATT